MGFSSPPYDPGIFNVSAFGIVGDGTNVGGANDIAWATLLAAASSTGGVIFFPPGTYRFDEQWNLPNDGESLPTQKSLTIQGSGHGATGGRGLDPSGGTILDLRYNGVGVAKILTRGFGQLTIENLALTDSVGSGSTAFFLTTNTCVYLRDLYFRGTRAGALADQDAILFGGTTNVLTGGPDDGPFQGYGSVVQRCYFAQVRRCFYGRAYCNGVVVRDNAVWSNCGGTAAFELAGYSASEFSNGNVFSGNLVEVTNYAHAFALTNASNNCLISNNYFDPVSTTTSYVDFGSGASYNLVVHGYHNDTKTDVTDALAVRTNTVLSSHQSQTSYLTQPQVFTNLSAPITVRRLSSGTAVGVGIENSAGDRWDETMNAISSGNAPWTLRFTSATRTVTDGVTNTDTSLTSATAAFTSADVGRPVTGTGIAASTVVSSVTNATTVVLSAATTATATGVSVVIGGTVESVIQVQRASLTDKRILLQGTTGNRITASGPLNIFSAVASSLLLGDATNSASVTNGILSALKGFTAGRQALTYGTTVAVAPGSGRYMVLTVTDTVGFTISNPSAATNGQEIEFKVVNSSGGAMGTITWGSQYKMDATWANPASTKSKTIRFSYDGTNWIQSGAPSGDI